MKDIYCAVISISKCVVTFTAQIIISFIIYKILVYSSAIYLQHMGVYEYLRDVDFRQFAFVFILTDTIIHIIFPEFWDKYH